MVLKPCPLLKFLSNQRFERCLRPLRTGSRAESLANDGRSLNGLAILAVRENRRV